MLIGLNARAGGRLRPAQAAQAGSSLSKLGKFRKDEKTRAQSI